MILNENYQILFDIESIDNSTKVYLFGAGSSGREFLRYIQAKKPELNIECFFDSFNQGFVNNIEIKKPEEIFLVSKNSILIITSIFWKEIIQKINFPFVPYILSNKIAYDISNLSSLGNFYFEKKESVDLELRFDKISSHFKTDRDLDIFRSIFDLRVYRDEENFFEKSIKYTSQQNTPKKYNKYYSLFDIGTIEFIFEGGVFDGEDTFFILDFFKNSLKFKKLFAFDPYPEAFENGSYINKIDATKFEFYKKVLWSDNEMLGFLIDKENPENSRIIRQNDFKKYNYNGLVFEAITIDNFVASKKVGLDLLKLDVEGSELNILKGAEKSILKHKPQMALSIYHRKEDLLEIPEFLLSLHKDYIFSMSMTNCSFIDNVLYAF